MEIKGEVTGEEEFHFSKDFIVKKTAKNSITLFCIHTDFGDVCMHQKMRSEVPDEQILPHPNLKKSQNK